MSGLLADVVHNLNLNRGLNIHEDAFRYVLESQRLDVIVLHRCNSTWMVMEGLSLEKYSRVSPSIEQRLYLFRLSFPFET